MPDDNLVTRREFTLEWAMAILSAATITISCGDDGPTTSPTLSGDHRGTVSANHGHIATVTAAKIAAPAAFSLDIRGEADHPHLVDLTAAEITSIGQNVRVTKTSSTDDFHSHTVTFN
ncbi:MAG TPA: hypothetical protein VGF24_09745 [Vicinamibacterales bacterium]|jgi:hypothetical protein